MRKEFSQFGDIVEYVEYEFRGSLNVHIVYADKSSVEKALNMNLVILEGHRIRVTNVTFKFIRRRNILITMLDDPNVTEDELFKKYSKNTMLSCVNKIFPYAYLEFPHEGIKSKALLKYRASGMGVLDTSKTDMVRHTKIIQYQNTYPYLKSTITVSNLSDSIKDKDLKTLLHKYGTILGKISIQRYGYKQATSIIKLKDEAMGKKSEHHKKFIFAKTMPFSSILAISATELNNTFFEGRRIHVHHGDKFMLPNYGYSVIADNIWFDSTEEEIYDIFKQFGEIEQVNRGFLEPCQVLIEYKDKTSVEKAIQLTQIARKTGESRHITVSKLIGPLCKFIQYSQTRLLQTFHGLTFFYNRTFIRLLLISLDSTIKF